jgi:RNA polymerase sigma-70 factor (ECF subfamily)
VGSRGVPTGPLGPARIRCAGTVTASEDTQLLARLRAGDEAAFDLLVRRYHGPLKRLARAFVSTEASAEEVVQDTWVAVLAGLDAFEERASLGTWISRILVNRSRTKGVREARMTPFSAMSDGEGEAEATWPDGVDPARFDDRGMWATPPERWADETPEKLVGNQEAMTLLDAELRDLPERQRVVVVLRDTLGWTAEDVCNALDINETNQRVLLHRARSRLRARLAAHLDRR